MIEFDRIAASVFAKSWTPHVSRLDESRMQQCRCRKISKNVMTYEICIGKWTPKVLRVFSGSTKRQSWVKKRYMQLPCQYHALCYSMSQFIVS